MKIKKRFSQIAAVALSVILLLSSVCFTAFAAGETKVGDIASYPQEMPLTDTQKEIIQKLYDSVSAFGSYVNISSYGITLDEMQALASYFQNVFPELFYLKNVSCSYNPSTNIGVGYIPYYVDGYDETSKQEFFTAAADRYLTLVDNTMDKFTKALILHDALILNSAYPYPLTDSNRGDNYTYMVNGTGVCQYYSQCYAYLLAQCGIKCEYVSSDSMNHAWLKIQLDDGCYYNIDNTWDDPVVDKEGVAKHTYFLYSDSAFQQADSSLSRKAHSGYLSLNPADSTTYDGFSNLHSIKTELCYIDGCFYAICGSKLVLYHPDTDAVESKQAINYHWPADGGGYWQGTFSGLAAYDGKLYYNGPDAVYSYDPATGENKPVYTNTASKKLYGLRIIDGKLYGLHADSPNVACDDPVFLMDLSQTSYDDNVGARLAGHTISLDGDIGVNFYMELDDAVAQSSTAYMQFTIPTGETTQTVEMPVSEAQKKILSGKTYYVFKCRVAAKEMDSEIHAHIVNGDVNGKIYTYSVQEYANAVINGNYRESLKNLVKSMLNYGAYAQIYFGGSTEIGADASAISGITAQTIKDAIGTNTYSAQMPAGVEFSGATLSLKSETTLSLYFTSESTLSFGSGVEKESKGSYQIARVRNIPAKQLGEEITVGVDSGSVTYSPMIYCIRVLDGGSDNVNLQNAVKALYRYWVQAKAYFE